eukprot:TRINITY_DN6615_c0_g1_i1.p1 TRINITY_DN6615_c0_g1~~TRINITY_DN6615_c0_g1_i1.p1  ORF type:complete len:345 (-),score=54.30 TRINITY_DN6615_c0_g1_i1:43-1077(-)
MGFNLLFWHSIFNGSQSKASQSSSVVAPPSISPSPLAPLPLAPEPKARSSKLLLFACGGTAGAVAKTVCAPLERLKILFQTQSELYKTPKYQNIVQGIKVIIKEEGMLALYRGNGANVARVIPSSAVRFASYDIYKSLLNKYGWNPELKNMLAGGLAGTSIVFSYPMDVIKTRLNVSSKAVYTGITDCAVRTWKAEGVRGFYRGFIPSFIGVLPYNSLSFACYDKTKTLVLPLVSNPQLLVLAKLGCGALAALFAQVATFPIDTVRRRLQLQGSFVLSPLVPGQRSTSTLRCITKIYQKEGVLGFYSGLQTSIFKSVPASSIQFACYDVFKRVLHLEENHVEEH